MEGFQISAKNSRLLIFHKYIFSEMSSPTHEISHEIVVGQNVRITHETIRNYIQVKDIG